MRAAKALLATRNRALFHWVHCELAERQNISLMANAAEEPQTLAIVQVWRPEVVLLDADSFGPGVVEVVRKILARNSATSVLLFYADCTAQRVVGALKNGCSGCLETAFRRGDVLRAFDAIDRGEIWAPRKMLSLALQETRSTPRAPLHGADPAPALHPQLSPRECEIVDWMRRGMSNKEIARELGISAMTVKTHAHNIFHKLSVSGRLRLLGSGHQIDSRTLAGAPGLAPTSRSAAARVPGDSGLKPAA